MKPSNDEYPLFLKNNEHNPRKFYEYAEHLETIGAKEEAKKYREIGLKLEKNKKKKTKNIVLFSLFLSFLLINISIYLLYDMYKNRSVDVSQKKSIFVQSSSDSIKQSVNTYQKESKTRITSKDSCDNCSNQNLKDSEELLDDWKRQMRKDLKKTQQELRNNNIEKPSPVNLLLTPLEAEDTSIEKLELAIVQVAIEEFKKKENRLPLQLKELIQDYPKNYLSFLPSGINFSSTNQTYRLEKKNQVLTSAEKQELTLELYPSTNQLVYRLNKTPIFTFLVASGKKPLPFHKSKVTERVVNPNSGIGAFGTRGLALHDNYAIHGTNKPNSIGKKVSKGCIRMYNQDIEKLYPYVPLGTNFEVKSEEQPLLTHSFSKSDKNKPKRGNSNEGQPNEGQPNEGQPNEGQPNEGQPNEGQPNEENPNQTYSWNN